MTSTPAALTYPAGHDMPRVLLLGACSLVAAFAFGLAGSLADEPLAAWLTAASFAVWIPGVRALLLIAAGLQSRGLWRATLGMFWSSLLLEVFLRGTETEDRGAAVLVAMLAAFGTLGVLFYLFRPQAKDDANHGTVKVFAVVGVGLLVVLKVLAKAKFFAKYAIARGASSAARHVGFEVFEIALGAVLILFLFTCLFAIGIVLIRRGAKDRLFVACGWLSVASVVATLVMSVTAIVAAVDDPAANEPANDALLELPHALWTASLFVLLVSLRRRVLPPGPDRVSLTD